MKNTFWALFCLLALPVFSQNNATPTISAPAAVADTIIYDVVEQMPLPMMQSCQPSLHLNWNIDSVRRCAETQFMTMLSQNIRYPAEARTNNVQGKVITQFVVDLNGKISNLKVLKDIGSGCGDEALRVLNALNEAGLQWIPAKQGDHFVRFRMTVPLKFRLEEALPYYISEHGDTLYSQVEVPLNFQGGGDSLYAYVLNRVEYPRAYRDSCKTGIIEMSLIIKPDGAIKVDNLLDFNNLGDDFQFNAIRLANRSNGLWIPAKFGSRTVATSYPMRVLYKSSAAVCAAANEQFDKAMVLADEAALLTEQSKHEAAIQKFTAALQLHPRNTELLYFRGNAYLALGKKDEGCQDFAQINNILGITWFEQLRRMICGW